MVTEYVIGCRLKNFMDPLEVVELQKLVFFVHCSVPECLANQQTTVLEISLSIALFELNRTICLKGLIILPTAGGGLADFWVPNEIYSLNFHHMLLF